MVMPDAEDLMAVAAIKQWDETRSLRDVVERLGTMQDALSALADRVMDRERYADRPCLHILTGDADYPDVWVLAWRGDAGRPEETDIHDHDGSHVAFHVAMGNVREVTYALNNPATWRETVCDVRVTDHVARRGATVTLGVPAIHVVAGLPGQRLAMTIHAYYPALTAMNLYTETGGKLYHNGRWEDDRP